MNLNLLSNFGEALQFRKIINFEKLKPNISLEKYFVAYMLVHLFYVMIVLKTKISCARKYLTKKKCI